LAFLGLEVVRLRGCGVRPFGWRHFPRRARCATQIRREVDRVFWRLLVWCLVVDSFADSLNCRMASVQVVFVEGLEATCLVSARYVPVVLRVAVFTRYLVLGS